MEKNKNPFIFGSIVKGEYFCNRKEEMEWIHKRAGKVNIIIVSPRRFGKTSLILNTMEKYDIPYVYVDIAGVESREQFLEKLIEGYGRAEKDVVESIMELLKELSIEVEISYNPFKLRIKNSSIDSIERVIDKMSKKRVIIIDEFQDISNLGNSFVWEFRGIVQRKGGYVFSGSKKSILLNLFFSPKQPFYKIGEMLNIDKISYDDWRVFIKKWFGKAKMKIEEQEIMKVYEIAEGIPFYVQYLCHYLWEAKKEGKGIKYTIKEIIDSNSYVYENLFSSLPKSQQKSLVLLANEEKPFSRNTYLRYGFNSSQQVQKALYSLEKKEFIEKNGTYRFLDPLFKLWVKLYQKV